MIYQPRPYQDFAKKHIIDNSGSGLFMDMGLGKTVVTLTSIDELIFDRMEVSKVLVIAPKKVAEDVWTTETDKWDHLRHLKISLVLGSERQRLQALRDKADIYVINRENVAWLVSYYGLAFPFDMVVIDELSSFKASDSARFKALKSIRPVVKRVVGLTGTPAPNGLMDLWSQLYLLDQGKRLGTTITGYREKYFVKRFTGYGYDTRTVDKDEADLIGDDYYNKKIYDRIGDICISMKAEDYLQLPKRIDTTHFVKLPDDIYKQYLEFEKKQILALDDREHITAINAAALTNKLLQFANGAVYDDQKNYVVVHSEKMEALAEDIEALNGKPILVFYSFRSDLERMMKYLKPYGPVELKGPNEIKLWNQGKIPVMIAHPASAGHGLNLQDGGHHLAWYGLPWSLELRQQGIGRLDRSGQKHAVINKSFAVRNTIDEDVIAALNNKTSMQDALLNAVKVRIDKYKSKKAA
jgi:SNF2 family DNA or RNA helicase